MKMWEGEWMGAWDVAVLGTSAAKRWYMAVNGDEGTRRAPRRAADVTITLLHGEMNEELVQLCAFL